MFLITSATAASNCRVNLWPFGGATSKPAAKESAVTQTVRHFDQDLDGSADPITCAWVCCRSHHLSIADEMPALVRLGARSAMIH